VFFNNECNSENQNNIKDKFKNSIVTPIGSLKENTMNSISGTILYVAVDNKYIGKIIIADQEKEDSRYAINNLKKLGITDIIMLTGDKKQIAEKVAKDLKINKVYAELLPTEKVKKIENLLTNNVKNRLGKVAFVGDGINDAPVLARADIGIAMGGLGSDAAIEASDIVVMTDEPSKVAKAIRIAKNTIKIAKENITFAIMIKILILILSAFGIATMWEAVFADVGVTIIAVLNSFRTMNTKKI
jgi:Cd2+/Zn2+-exporting ATPase